MDTSFGASCIDNYYVDYKMKPKALIVTEDLHDLVKYYCVVNHLNMKEFVTSELYNIPKLKKASEERKRLTKI